MKKLSFLFLCIFSSLPILASTITSVACGSWLDPASWDLQRLPAPRDTIRIKTFIAFDTDFTSQQPGLLIVEKTGSLCGLHAYTGSGQFSGPVFISRMYHIYGNSFSDTLVIFRDVLSVTGSGSYTVRYRTCVGCTMVCDSCRTRVVFPNVPNPQPLPEPEIPFPEEKLELPNLLIRNGVAENRFLIPSNENFKIESLRIFNRWGKEVHQSRDNSPTWEIKDVLEGIYFYEMECRFEENGKKSKPKTRHGWVRVM